MLHFLIEKLPIIWMIIFGFIGQFEVKRRTSVYLAQTFVRKLQNKRLAQESYRFYVIALSDQGVDGAVRAGFELQNDKLIYRINNHKIDSGQIKTK